MLDQPYVPINVAALSEAGHRRARSAPRCDRGDEVLRSAGLKPDGGPWVDTASTFSQGDAGNLASGLQVAGAVPARAQRRRPGLGRREQLHLRPALHARPRATAPPSPAVAADSTLEHALHRRPGQPGPRGRAAARRALLRPLRERVPRPQPRGRRGHARRRAGSPRPPSWTTLLGGLTGNPALKPGDRSASSSPRCPPAATTSPRCASCSPGRPATASRTARADRIALDRQQLSSFSRGRRRAPRQR